MLFGYGLLQLLFMLRLMPWYLSQPFNASFWSFSFGVSALATTGLHLGSGSDNGFFHTLAVPLFIFTNFIIAILLIRTFALLMQGKIVSQNRARRFNESRGQRMIIRDENYFTDKYELTRTHSEVLEAVKVVKPGKTLDLGCGNGRNSLYLAANGYDVDAWDKNAMSIANVERIKSIENLDNLHTRVVDLNNLTFDRQYDFILSTVVLMFLEAKTIPGLIANMQRCTKPWWLQPDCGGDGYR